MCKRRDDRHRFNAEKGFSGFLPSRQRISITTIRELHFHYTPYDLGSYAEGDFDLYIDWPLPDVILAHGFTTPPKQGGKRTSGFVEESGKGILASL